MEFSFTKQQSKVGMVVKEVLADGESDNNGILDSIFSSSSESNFTDEVTSSSFSLNDMSPLLQKLPKRGLSKHYHGKSQSFTSLSKVRCLEDLAEPENPYVKRLKLCKSNGGLQSETEISCTLSSRTISKKASSSMVASCSSLNAKATDSSSFRENRPPIPKSFGTTSFSNQNPLFA